MYARRHTGRVPLFDLADAIDRSAAPVVARLSVERLVALQPDAVTRMHDPRTLVDQTLKRCKGPVRFSVCRRIETR